MKKFIILCFALIVTSCASVNYSRLDDFQVKLAVKNKEYAVALKELSQRFNEANKEDKLLILLNMAMINHYDGNYKESNKNLFIAKQYIEYSTDSLKTKAIHTFVSDDIGKHSLELHEELFVFTLISLNYALMDNLSESLVEAKFYDKYISSKENIFFSPMDNKYLNYLSGIYYQSQGMFYDSLIDYKRVEKNDPSFPYIGFDLFQNMKILNDNEYKDVANRYGLPMKYLKDIENSKTEVIVLFMNGLGPYKTEQPNYPKVAKYVGQNSYYSEINVSVNGIDYGKTIPLYDIEQTAISSLEKQYKTLVIRDLKRLGTQELLTLPLHIMSGGIGLIASAFVHTGSSSNFRYWEFMPKEIQIARIKLVPGIHKIKANYYDGTTESLTINLKKNQTKFVEFRSQK